MPPSDRSSEIGQLQYTFDGLTQEPKRPRAAALAQARRAAQAGVGVGTRSAPLPGRARAPESE